MRNLVIECEFVPPKYRFDPAFPVRGTDKFYVKTAEAVAKSGKFDNVVVLYDGDETKFVKGVTYVPRSQWLAGGASVWLRCNPRGYRPRPKHVDYFMVWTNFALPSGFYADFVKNCPDVDRICVISQYAKARFQADCGQIDLKVVPHGIDHGIYNRPEVEERQPRVCFTSSPDRGLDVIRQVWQDYELAPYAELWASSYGTQAKSDGQVADVLRTSDFWVHPGVGEELFCLAAVEAQACGATPIVVPNGALAETARFGYRSTAESFAETLATAVTNRLTLKGVHANWNPSWEQATAILFDYSPRP